MMNKLIYLRFRYFLLVLTGILFFTACNKEDEPEPQINEDNEEFFTFMKDWYFWTDNIPEIDPSAYSDIFEVLEAVRYQPLDRWSFIIDWQEFLDYFQESKFIGYGFGSSWDSNGKLRISFIHNTGELYQNGVRRGWIIEAINGTGLTQGMNINQMLGPNEEGISNTFLFKKPDNSTIDITAAKMEMVTNTVLHHEVFEAENIKIGYMVLQSFRDPTEEELNEVFADFFAEDIDELILDMRYNGGGLTRIATQLASLIAGPSLAGQPFAKTVYNSIKEDEYNRTDNLLNLENSLGLSRLVTIATRGTASASEMIINGLKPYMDVYVVGNDTYGKPMGSNVFNYNDTWALAPITFKVRNADNEGDYFDGLPVDIPANDDLSRDFGDPMESSLQQAIAFILTGSTKGSTVIDPVVKQPWEDMKGLRWESRSH
jgi:C-terminal processing protease CtpA/Prc